MKYRSWSVHFYVLKKATGATENILEYGYMIEELATKYNRRKPP